MSLIKQTKPTEFTVKEFAGYQIKQRADGYLNATEMCKVGKKEWSGYLRNNQTKEYLDALDIALQIHRAQLIESITANVPNRGTWVHPKIAIHLAMWISPSFAVQVTDWVYRFLSGDISLVKDVVDRHDAVNNTVSQVSIKTYDRQIDEYKKQINDLTNNTKILKSTANKLNSKIEELNKLSCPYCNRSYSNTSGLTNHINNKCEENRKQKFLAIINLNAFKKYINLLINNWDELKDTYKFTMKKINWNTDKPKLLIICKNKKELTYHIYNNSSRAKIVNILNKKKTIPINLLIDVNTLEMINNNNLIIEAIIDFKKYEVDLFADEFADILNENTDNESNDELYDDHSDPDDNADDEESKYNYQ